MKIDVEDIIGSGDIAKMAFATIQTIGNWRSRDPKFPKPIKRISTGDLYDRSAVVEYLKTERGVVL